MVMDLLGPSLEDLFNKCGRRFSLKTVLQIADQLLERVKTMHTRHIIHRDVKPANFVLGPGQTIFCIDLGLSAKYEDPDTLMHIGFRSERPLTGNMRYASINNHLGVEPSRRDDLESIGYILVYFLTGSLPWQGVRAWTKREKCGMILERKESMSVKELCQGLPQQFADYLAYCRSLKFDAKPDMTYLQTLLSDLYKAQGYSSAGSIEWDWGKFVDKPQISYASAVINRGRKKNMEDAAATSRNILPDKPTSYLVAALRGQNGSDRRGGQGPKIMKNRRWNGSLPNTTRVDPAIVKYARPLTAHSKRGNSATIGCGKTFLNRRGAAGGYVVYPVVANVRGMMRCRNKHPDPQYGTARANGRDGRCHARSGGGGGRKRTGGVREGHGGCGGKVHRSTQRPASKIYAKNRSHHCGRMFPKTSRPTLKPV
ncbi:unnamed protein product [Ascophyllum nodosum]